MNSEKLMEKFVNGIELIGQSFTNVNPLLEEMNHDDLVGLLQQINGLETKNWVLQSDILVQIKKKAKRGDEAVKKTAAELNMSKGHAYELVKINEDILQKDPALRDIPNLTYTHYQVVIRQKEIKSSERIRKLKDASDNNWSPEQLKRTINNQPTNVTFEMAFYEIGPKEKKAPASDDQLMIQEKISADLAIVKTIGGKTYLQRRIYTN